VRAGSQKDRRTGKVRVAFATVVVQDQDSVDVDLGAVISGGKEGVGSGRADVHLANPLSATGRRDVVDIVQLEVRADAVCDTREIDEAAVTGAAGGELPTREAV